MSIDVTVGDGVEARPADGFLTWPGWSHLIYASTLGMANGIWFMLVFAGCDLVTSQRSLRIPVHFAVELSIPSVAEMTAVYMSMYLLFLAGPFILRTRNEFRAAVTMLALIIGIAGLVFLWVPSSIAYQPVSEAELGMWAGMFHLADDLNLTYNLLPSLHVALTVACVSAFATHARTWVRAALWFWATSVALSTLLTHQHHVLDVLTGWILARACFHIVFLRMTACDLIDQEALEQSSR